MIVVNALEIPDALQRLNPCCNGIYLMIILLIITNVGNNGLNPCCNGIYLMIQSRSEH